MSSITILGIGQILIGVSFFGYAIYLERSYRDGVGFFIVGSVTAVWGAVAIGWGLVL